MEKIQLPHSGHNKHPQKGSKQITCTSIHHHRSELIQKITLSKLQNRYDVFLLSIAIAAKVISVKLAGSGIGEGASSLVSLKPLLITDAVVLVGPLRLVSSRTSE